MTKSAKRQSRWEQTSSRIIGVECNISMKVKTDSIIAGFEYGGVHATGMRASETLPIISALSKSCVRITPAAVAALFAAYGLSVQLVPF